MLDHEGQAGTAQNQTLPVEFKFENHAVRTIMAGDEIQFVAADVCEVLGIKNPTDAIGRLADDEKALAFIEGIPGGQRINVVNQFGLTRLILRSNKPKAKQFQRWVIHDVLPSIYKTGRYDTKQDEAQPRLASSDDNVFVREPRPPASTPFAHYIVSVTPEGSNIVEPSDFDPISAQRTKLDISAQRTKLDLRLLAHKMLAVETLWIKARLLIPELSYKYPSLNGLHSAILDTSTLANEFT